LLHTALKILVIRKYACKFLPCLQKKFARKSAYISYEHKLLNSHPEKYAFLQKKQHRLFTMP